MYVAYFARYDFPLARHSPFLLGNDEVISDITCVLWRNSEALKYKHKKWVLNCHLEETQGSEYIIQGGDIWSEIWWSGGYYDGEKLEKVVQAEEIRICKTMDNAPPVSGQLYIKEKMM